MFCLCAGIVTNEVRYLLTRGNGYGQLVSQVPPGHCLKIESHNVPDQFEEVLRYYNIILPSCIQPRCEVSFKAFFTTMLHYNHYFTFTLINGL